MKYFSMFSGIGGFELGIQRAYNNKYAAQKQQDWERGDWNIDEQPILLCTPDNAPLCVGYSEIDKYAIQIYKKHFGGHKNYGNAKDINPEQLPDFDLLVGGFPCQAFSIAGKRRGFEDTRGTLFFEIARVLKGKQPRMFLLENVKGLLNHDKGETFTTILKTIDELGYDAEWQVLNSKHFGVPQNRERVFIIGYLRGFGGRKVFPIRGSNKEIIQNCQKYEGQEIAWAIRGRDYKDGTNFVGCSTRTRSYIHQPEQIEIRHDKVSNQLTTIQKDSMVTGNKIIRRLTPTECERLQGFPDNWTFCGTDEKGKHIPRISDTQRYKCLGNAVTVNVIEAIMRNIII